MKGISNRKMPFIFSHDMGPRELKTLGPVPRAHEKSPQPLGEAGGQGKKTGGALLSRAPGRSTIAAGALNGRVRDGNGCGGPAMATGQ